MTKQIAFFTWDGPVSNYVTVCLLSLRECNPECRIIVYYLDERFRAGFTQTRALEIEFRKLDRTKWEKRRMTQRVELLQHNSQESADYTEILSLDCDLYFQRDPFQLISENASNDLFYTTVVMSLFHSIDYPVNGGVFCIIVNKRSRQLIDFWLNNLKDPTWPSWLNDPLRKSHQNFYPDWFCDQDFLNCIHNNKLPFAIKIVDVGHKHNYYTSKIGFYDKSLEMNAKLGDSGYAIIHWKGFWKSFYNLENPRIYNLSNLRANRRLYRWHNKRTLRKIIKSREVSGQYPWI